MRSSGQPCLISDKKVHRGRKAFFDGDETQDERIVFFLEKGSRDFSGQTKADETEGASLPGATSPCRSNATSRKDYARRSRRGTKAMEIVIEDLTYRLFFAACSYTALDPLWRSNHRPPSPPMKGRLQNEEAPPAERETPAGSPGNAGPGQCSAGKGRHKPQASNGSFEQARSSSSGPVRMTKYSLPNLYATYSAVVRVSMPNRSSKS